MAPSCLESLSWTADTSQLAIGQQTHCEKAPLCSSHMRLHISAGQPDILATNQVAVGTVIEVTLKGLAVVRLASSLGRCLGTKH